MDRINGQDTVDIGGGRRGFQGQNAAAGIPGTEVTAAYLNSVQEEIMAIIEKAGLTADPNDWSQLWQALNKLTLPGYRGVLNWLAVKAIDVTAPPSDAQTGDTYLIPDNATGNWQGHKGQIAVRDDAGWIYITPKDGHGFGLPDGRIFIRANGVYIEKTAKTVRIIAGNGLVGGGKLDQDRTIELSPDILDQIANAVIPVSAIQAFATRKLPEKWVECDGRELSRKDFSDLFDIIGTVWGAGDGTTTFNVPDYRGVFLRGFDHGRGIDPDRNFAELQQDDFEKHDHGGNTDPEGGHDHDYSKMQRSGGGPDGTGNWGTYDNVSAKTSYVAPHRHKIPAEGGSETRPVNQTVVYAIKSA